MVICIAEDRKSCEVSVKLLVLSLARHCPEERVELFYPPADCAFRIWLQRCPRVCLNVESLPNARGFNVKPQALLNVLERGYDDVLWVDSDIIIARDFRSRFTGLTDDTLVAAEEALYGAYEDTDAMRTRAWGFPVGRNLPFATNSCIVRVTQTHRPLLNRWQELLESSIYKNAQSLVWSDRPAHLHGDQDVLTALLASSEFAAVPLRFMQRGSDIIQYFGLSGYTMRERMTHIVRGLPPFLHSQVSKPWLKPSPTSENGLRQYFTKLYLDLSPYTLEAKKFRTDLAEDCSWMKPRLRGGIMLRAAGFGYAQLAGLPLAACADTVHLMKRYVHKIS